MKVLVTGASGFIGSNIVEELLKQGHSVIGLDNDIKKQHLLEDVIPKNTNMRYGDVNFISKNFSMIWDDVNNIRQYYFAMDGVERIYHLCASADIRKSFEEPLTDLHNNVLGTNEVLELMRLKDIKYLVFSSSSSVYGMTKITPTPEDVGDIRPISMYGASKLANEAFIHSYSDLYGFKSWIFRFANVVGRHEHRGVIVDFYNKLKKNKDELEILGNGEQNKSYFDVSDCIDGFLNIPEHDNRSVEIYNLANTTTMRVVELAWEVCKELGVSPRFSFTGGDRGWKGDTPYTILDIKKALSTGWKPKFTCKEAIRRTVRYLRERER